MEPIQLDFVDLGLALGMMAIAIGLSAWQGLGLEGKLALATARTVVQLLVVGSLLEVVFKWQHPLAVLAVIVTMVTIATVVSRNQIGKKIPVLPLIWGSLFASTALTVIYTNLLVLRSPEAWTRPQYLIPLTGIVLGTAMNGAAIAGERLVSTIKNSPIEIETHLSLGATPQQALAVYRQEAIKAGLIPTVNAMMVVGVVKLPGIITGQILSGVNPLNAAAYQILIMFMLAFATLITATILTSGLSRQFFNKDSQLQTF